MSNQPESGCGGWSRAMSGQFRWVPYGPDMYATYWYYCFLRQPGDTFGMRFAAEFPHSRFMSYNVYGPTGDFVNPPGGPPSSILDTSIVPDAGSRNPFCLAVDRGVRERDYTVLVVPDGAKEVVREDWELEGRDAAYVDHVTDDLTGFLEELAQSK